MTNKKYWTESEISNATGFDNGDLFENEIEVREYFTLDNMQEMFGLEYDLTQTDLNNMANCVIENRWHMTKPRNDKTGQFLSEKKESRMIRLSKSVADFGRQEIEKRCNEYDACPVCRESLEKYRILPTECHHCGDNRSS